MKLAISDAASQPVNESLDSLVTQVNVNYYASLVAFAVLYYDFLLTFKDEYRFFWGRKFNSVTVLFFLNRYLSLLGNIPVILQSFRNWNPNECDSLQKYHQFFSVIVQIIVGIIVILRTYALYERNRKIGLTMTFAALVVICVGVWSILGHSATVVLPYDLSFMLGCHSLVSHETGLRLSGAWGGLMLFDSVIFVLTFYKAIHIWRMGTRRLTHVLLRDGTIYYLVLAMANLSNILTFVLGEPLIRGVSTTFANAVSVTMVSRLMLNLQNPALFGAYYHSNTGATDTNLGPFVTTLFGRGSSGFASSSGSGSGYVYSSRHGAGTGTGTGAWTGEEEMYDDNEEEDSVTQRRGALWYDRAWVTGSRSATGTGTGTRREGDRDIEEDVELTQFSPGGSAPAEESRDWG